MSEKKNIVLYLNPGSANKPRGGSKRGIARLAIDSGKVAGVEFVTWE